MDKKEIGDRIKDIVKKAFELGWVEHNPFGYPKMQLSEVEKCIYAILDEDYMHQIDKWVEETRREKLRKDKDRGK